MSLLNEVAMSPVTVSEGEPSTHPWLGVPTHMCELASRASSFTCSTHEKVGAALVMECVDLPESRSTHS
jgi:hypothetical protein